MSKRFEMTDAEVLNVQRERAMAVQYAAVHIVDFAQSSKTAMTSLSCGNTDSIAEHVRAVSAALRAFKDSIGMDLPPEAAK